MDTRFVFYSSHLPRFCLRSMGEQQMFLTGYTYDKLMLNHQCPWTSHHHENPGRLSSILDRCQELNLFHRCLFVPCIQAKDEDILLYHSERLLKNLSACPVNNTEDLKSFCQQFDDVYLNEVKNTND